MDHKNVQSVVEFGIFNNKNRINMTNLERAIVLYERINDAFVAYGEIPDGMIEDLKDICDELTDEELLKLDENE
jgi:hypothetical protein